MKYLHFGLKLSIWFLLTADLSLPNIIIGIALAVLLPHSQKASGTLQEWFSSFIAIIKAIPQAYKEAVEIMLFPHEKEDIICDPVKEGRSAGLVFLDIFLITFTPKTIVTKYDERGWYEVHRVKR